MTTLPDTGSNPNDPAKAITGDEVSWQTIYFIFIALAACTATQPCGRTLGIPKYYTPYLRTSPIDCIADATWIIFYAPVGSLFSRSAAKELLYDMLNRRFSEDKEVASGESSNKTIASFRWLWFLVSGLPQLIKLMAMSEVTGCQAIGLMFAISFVVVEVLLAFEQWSKSRRPILVQPNHNDRTGVYLSMFMGLTMGVSILLLWKESVAILDIIILGRTESQPKHHWEKFARSIVAALVALSVVACVTYVPYRMYTLNRRWTGFSFDRKSDAVLTMGMFFIFFQIGIMKDRKEQQPYVEHRWYFLLLIPFWIAATTFVEIVQSGRYIWAIWRQDRPRKFFTDVALALAMLWVSYHVVGSVLWFRYVFDDRGTVNPRWTSVFG